MALVRILQSSGNLGHHDHIISDGGGCPYRPLGAVLHADDVPARLLGLLASENISHSGLWDKKAVKSFSGSMSK